MGVFIILCLPSSTAVVVGGRTTLCACCAAIFCCLYAARAFVRRGVVLYISLNRYLYRTILFLSCRSILLCALHILTLRVPLRVALRAAATCAHTRARLLTHFDATIHATYLPYATTSYRRVFLSVLTTYLLAIHAALPRAYLLFSARAHYHHAHRTHTPHTRTSPCRAAARLRVPRCAYAARCAPFWFCGCTLHAAAARSLSPTLLSFPLYAATACYTPAAALYYRLPSPPPDRFWF